MTDAVEPASRENGTWRGPVLEGVVSFLTAAVFGALSLLIRVNPLDRVGQISGLAHLAFRFFLFAIVLAVALLVYARIKEGKKFGKAWRLVCAAIAGLASGIIAGGIAVALRGTPWGLNGRGGDAGALAQWATALQKGESIPPTYPPLALHILALYSDTINLRPELALKHMEIIGVAMFGPLAYCSWRLIFRPGWALAIGVIAMLPLVEPYKPFPNLVLVSFLPVSILFLDTLRRLPERDPLQVARIAVGFGAFYGISCLTYSGWFQWAAPGLFAATLIIFPYKTAPRRAALLLGLTGLVFFLFVRVYLFGLLFNEDGAIKDRYIYFDTKTDPMYIAMYRNDTPGPVGMWPPIGELGGVGLFTILLITGFGFAVALGRRTTLVIGLVCMIVGAFVFRFFYARMMWETKLVQLYPRTTPLILYSLLVLCGYAIHLALQRTSPTSFLRRRDARIAGAFALMLLFASTGTAFSDRYMPVNTTPPGAGWLTWNSHMTKRSSDKRPHTASPVRWIRRSDR